MAPPIMPVAKAMYICDDVVRDPQSGKVSLLNLWDTIRVPPGGNFPYCLGKLCVFGWWRDGFGKVTMRVDVVEAATNQLVGRTTDRVVDFKTRSVSVFTRFKLENWVFPAPGSYFVELYCENQFVDDQVIRVLAP